MKKIVVMLMTLTLLLCACDEKTPASELTPNTEPTTAATTEPVTTPTAEPTTEPTTAPTTEPASEENTLSFGRMEGGIYSNSYAGFGCQLNANWSFYGAQELQELPELVNGAVEGSDMADLMENYTQIFDMQAENVNDLLSMNVVYVKLGIQERLMYAVMTEEQIVDETLKLKDMMIQAYAQAGMEVTAMEKAKVTFLGEEHFAIRTLANTQGIPVYMLQIIDYNLGSYGMTLTATSYLEDKTQNVLDMFYTVE